MPQIDSLLRLVRDQGADELRLGTDRAPAMFAAGTPKTLTMPKTSSATLFEILGELLGDKQRAELQKLQRTDFSHDAPKAGPFDFTITKRVPSEPSDAPFAIDVVCRKRQVSLGGGPSELGGPSPRPTTPSPSESETPIEARAPRFASKGPSSESDTTTGPVASYQGASEPARARTRALFDDLPPALVELIRTADARGASDLHLTETEAPRLRVMGRLIRLPSNADAEAEIVSWLQAFDAALSAGRAEDAAISAAGIRCRVNVFRSERGIGASIRLLRRAVPSLRDLGFPLALEDLATYGSGLVLVVGPTGGGKSTTLAALIQETLRARSVVLVTLEDPIEYVFASTDESLVRQREIGRHVASFSDGLREALREDPDVIMVGEMRDQASIELALTAAETGHLVFASLHARGAAQAIERIADAVSDRDQPRVRSMLSESLRAVVGQRLIPNLEGGRTLACELLRNTTAVAAAIRDGKTGPVRSAMQSGRESGMLIGERHLADLVKARIIGLDAAREAAVDRALLDQYLSR